MRQDESRKDIYAAVTDTIVAAIERGAGTFQMPWHQRNGALSLPTNIASGQPYNGVNVLVLWGSASLRGYEAPLWGTFRQWLAKGHPVRKGERATPGVFYKDILVDDENGGAPKRVAMARGFSLFNAAQVEGFTPPETDIPRSDPVNAITLADAFLKNCGAVTREGGDQAYYHIAEDRIQLPDRALFFDTETSTATQSFYGVALHEHVHWTGAAVRLNRDFKERFKTSVLAMEELTAELGAAMLCAELGVAAEPRLDHAQYVASWLTALRNDKRAIFTAASAAQKAVVYLHSLQPGRPVHSLDGDVLNDIDPA